MSPATKKWISRCIKFGVCITAILYLSTKVSLDDRVVLVNAPDVKHVVISHDDTGVRIRDEKTGQERHVPWSAVAITEHHVRNQDAIERGLASIVLDTDWSWTAWAILAFGPAPFVIAWRLRLLLRTQDIPIGYLDSLLLTFAGNFFNFAMPGTTGGDLYKAYHIAKRTHKRTEGVTVVFLDRVIGLISFLLLAAVAIFLARESIGQYGRWVGYAMIVFFVTAGLFFSRRFRRLIRYDALLERLPFGDKLRRIDDTAFSFRYHPRAMIASLAVTVGIHFLLIASVYLLARGLGITPRGDRTSGDLILACFLAVVVGYLFAAIPISIQGFGLLEAVFQRVLVEGHWCGWSEMLALTLGARLIQIVWALPGVVVPWLGFARPTGDPTTSVPPPEHLSEGHIVTADGLTGASRDEVSSSAVGPE